MIAQIRLENTELKHRVRLLQSRAGKAVSGSPGADASLDKGTAYSKLKREFEAVKKQLSDVTSSFVSLRKQQRERTSTSQKRDSPARRDSPGLYAKRDDLYQRQAREVSRLKSPAYDPYLSNPGRRRPPYLDGGYSSGGSTQHRRTLSDDEGYRNNQRRRDIHTEKSSYRELSTLY
jgi:hypothetical protein